MIIDADQQQPTATATAPPGERALAIHGVDKRFPGVHALKGVTLDVRAGEVHAIVGENGAGKSTLMAVAAGVLACDAGTIELGGIRVEGADPETIRALGLAIVYQEPALVRDLTVAENALLTLPPQLRVAADADGVAGVAALLAPWRAPTALDPRSFVRDLAPDERFIVEIARALAGQPRVLVLDEPTEHLLAEDVERLFAAVRALTAAGGAVIYISHRIPEVREIADRITVLRDGAVRSTLDAAAVSEDEVVALIVGRELASRFPPKAAAGVLGVPRLELRELRGAGLDGATLAVGAGEIVGLAGIVGQGQRELLRTVAGLTPTDGEIRVDGRATRLRTSAAAERAGIVYVPADRHAEGVFPALSVRENLMVRGLRSVARAGFVRADAERAAAGQLRAAFGIKTPGLEAGIDTLSGGNQQKTVLARALPTDPAILLADEPSQGVDVGARAEIYDILRASADGGACVLLASSDNAELEGLCDRVLVVSRGRVIAELAGDDVREAAITHAVLTSTAARRDAGHGDRSPGAAVRLRRLLRSDRAPAAVLVVAILALALWAISVDASYLSATNVTSVLTLFAALAFVALGQQLVMLTAGIDLSVGPLTGLLVVVASFELSEDRTSLGLWIGIAVLVGVAVLVGAVNCALIVVARIDPMIATLVSYMALQGVSLLLRPEPGGTISTSLADTVDATVGPIPIAAIVAAAVGLALERALRRRRWGWQVRAVGSDRGAAARVGIRTGRVLLGVYGGCALLTLCGALMLMGQVGSGDPNAGTSYTFASIAAVVLGGASIFGGRGSFLGALAGALLVVQINTVAVFVRLDDAWQLYLLGGLTVLAAGCYSLARGEQA
ncbi:ATP-binding cassette domain-containing protein [Baekduia alba]|uniref:ATP-binding cassette domain-containing protein n=1 Tax=Baekduia alba TaxID=2997333 RepID=UPI002340405A|nr:ATP-binding cassette domain-containing protein [Baekduia alba]